MSVGIQKTREARVTNGALPCERDPRGPYTSPFPLTHESGIA